MAESDFSAFFAALGLAGSAALAGFVSASFGESASAVPAVRNSDKVSAANFFIFSLFGTKVDVRPNLANHPAANDKEPVLQLRQLIVNIL